MLYNTTYTTNRVVLITTVDAQTDTEAYIVGLDTIYKELGLDLTPIRHQYEIEEA